MHRLAPLLALVWLGACGRPPLPSDYATDAGSEEGDGDGDEVPDPTPPDPTPPDPTPPDPTPPDPDPDPGCYEAPAECLTFVNCIAALVPEQAEVVAQVFGEGGSCWCDSTEDEAQECFITCVEQLEAALDAEPTESACHEQSCSLDELDPNQPYGPAVNGECPLGQTWLQSPFGIPGSYCAPPCEGLGNVCPQHDQTAAQGTCYIAAGEDTYCALRCWVDPKVVGGTQCHCGARCQPQGAPDGEGNLRGLCTFE